MSDPVELGTVAPIGFDDFPPRRWLARFRALGCTVVQAYRNQQAGVTVEQMRAALADGEMPCDSLHGVFGEQYDPSSPDDDARRFAVDTYRREGDLVRRLGGRLVVVHCSTIRREPTTADELARRWDQLRRSVEQLGRFGGEIGVTYAFENLPGYHPIGHDPAELARVLRQLAVPHTGMCFDTGHALMTGDPAEGIRAAAEQIAYVHLSDNSGRSDDHEMPTCGALDTPAVADALAEVGYRGTLMLEVFHSAAHLDELIADGCPARLAALRARAAG